MKVNTSLSNAEVLTTHGVCENYFAWEAGFKFGFFSSLSFYAEAGFDLTEALLHDFRHDHEIHYHYHEEAHYEEHTNELDSYVGIGLGLQAGPLKVEAFSRVRNIDSFSWQADPLVF